MADSLYSTKECRMYWLEGLWKLMEARCGDYIPVPPKAYMSSVCIAS